MIRIDLEEPKDCVRCPFYDDVVGVCLADKKFRIPSRSGLKLEEEKPDWCPCVELKEEFLPLHKHIMSIWVDAKSIVYNEEG